MSGIRILDTYYPYKYLDSALLVFACLVLTIIFILVVIKATCTGNKFYWALAAVCLVSTLILSILVEFNPSSIKHIRAYIDENTTFNEVVKDYNILDRHQDIWILEKIDANFE